MEIFKKVKDAFELHVALIMFYDGKTESAARFIAWSEGKGKLSERVEKTKNKEIITIAENLGV